MFVINLHDGVSGLYKTYYDTDAQFSEMNKNIRNWKNTYSKYPINLLKKK